MDQLGISEAAFCGLSLGSMVGLWLGAHAPHRIRRMLLAGASAYVEDKQAFDSRISRLRDGDLSREIPELLARWFTPAFLAGYPREISGVEAMVKATPLAGYIAAAMAVRDFDGREALSQIRCPVLLITGRGDLATPPRQAELIAERVPTARINVIENASHLAQEEKPDEFDQLLRDFYGI